MFYRWIVIKNSLEDESILGKYKILSETIFARNNPERESRMLKLQVSEEDIDRLANTLQKNITAPYYTHFYHEDPKVNKLIVIFEGKRFDTAKDNFQDAVDYGLAHDVSREEMNISPRDVSEEKW